MSDSVIGIMGGTGLGEALSHRSEAESIVVETPFGPPSDRVRLFDWEGQRVAFLARHGEGHTISPSSVPYRANIFALKKLGVTHVIASGACGSLREEIRPRHLVLPDQVIDKTHKRAQTFFDHDLAVHVEFAHPFCAALRKHLLSCAATVDTEVHDGGVYVCMEGPQFSTVAESRMHQAWGADLIGMTCIPEAKLAREAEICYALVALATDYDCWRPHDASVGPKALLDEIQHNLELATRYATELIQLAVGELASKLTADCPCQHALELAIWSDKSRLDKKKLLPLKPLLHKYVAFESES